MPPLGDNSAPKQRARGPGRPFVRGKSGNPAGKRRGSRNKATVLLDQLAEAEAGDLLHQVIAKAKGGDMVAAGLVLARIWPPRKGRPVRFDLPALNTPRDLPVAIAALIQAASEGELSPDEIAALASALDGWRRSVETVELQKQLDEMKAEVAAMRADRDDRR
jgi:Family of unknown function (DUF5681)